MANDNDKRRQALIEKLEKRRADIENDAEIPHKEAKPLLEELGDILAALQSPGGGDAPAKTPKKKNWSWI
jgi:hypothetical protein